VGKTSLKLIKILLIFVILIVSIATYSQTSEIAINTQNSKLTNNLTQSFSLRRYSSTPKLPYKLKIHTSTATILPTSSKRTKEWASGNSTIYEWKIPTSSSGPYDIAVNSSYSWGIFNIWFTEFKANKIGMFDPSTETFAEWEIPTSNSGPKGIAIDANGNIWFTEFKANKIGMFDPRNQSFIEYTIPTNNSGPLDITVDYEGNIWFTEYNANKIGKFNPTTKSFTEYTIPTSNSGPWGISYSGYVVTSPKTYNTTGIWFTEHNASKIGILFLNGQIIEYPTPTGNSKPRGIDILFGRLWFTEQKTGKIGYRESHIFNEIKELPINTTLEPTEITIDRGYIVWFTDSKNNKIYAIDPSTKNIKEYPIPTLDSNPIGIAEDEKGNIWFVENKGNKIGVIIFSARDLGLGPYFEEAYGYYFANGTWFEGYDWTPKAIVRDWHITFLTFQTANDKYITIENAAMSMEDGYGETFSKEWRFAGYMTLQNETTITLPNGTKTTVTAVHSLYNLGVPGLTDVCIVYPDYPGDDISYSPPPPSNLTNLATKGFLSGEFFRTNIKTTTTPEGTVISWSTGYKGCTNKVQGPWPYNPYNITFEYDVCFTFHVLHTVNYTKVKIDQELNITKLTLPQNPENATFAIIFRYGHGVFPIPLIFVNGKNFCIKPTLNETTGLYEVSNVTYVKFELPENYTLYKSDGTSEIRKARRSAVEDSTFPWPWTTYIAYDAGFFELPYGTINTTRIHYDPIIIFYHLTTTATTTTTTTTVQAPTLWTLWLYSLTVSLILATITTIIILKRKPKRIKTTIQ